LSTSAFYFNTNCNKSSLFLVFHFAIKNFRRQKI